MEDKPKRLIEFLEAENGNLVDLLDDSRLNEIGMDVIDEFEDDYNDKDYQAKKDCWKEGQEVAQLVHKPKNTPWPNAANIKYPLLTTAAIQFNSRAYPGIVQGNSVVKPKVFGSANPVDPRMEQLQQAAQQIQQLPPEQQQQAQMQLSKMAEAIQAESGNKIARADHVCEFINWQLFNEFEEWEPDTDKLLLMLPLYGTMFRCVYYSQEKKRICTELLSPEDLIVPMDTKHIWDATRISKCFHISPRKFIEKVRGGTYADIDLKFEDERSEQEEEFVEQFRWIDLDEDGYKEPYIVTVHRGSAKVVRISPNFRMEDVFANDDGEVSKIRPVKYFVKYSFIPSTDGKFYDLGFFDLLLPVNQVVNDTTNMLLDAGSLQNTGGGFISNDLGLRKKGSVRFELGEYKSIPASGEDIRKSIYQLPFNGPSPVLFQLLGFMLDAGRDIANLKEVLEGNQQPNQTATATMALIEQGLKVFSAIYKRIHRSLGDELQLIRFWNYEIRNPLYEEVLDERLSQDDFSDDDLDFVPVSDPAVVTDMQKMGRVQFLMQFLNDPYFDQVKLRQEIGEGASIDGFEELLGPNPEVQQLQQQLQQLQQFLQQMQTELNDDRIEKQLEAIKARAELDEKESKAVLNETSAIKNLADAEAAEAGIQLPQYQAAVQKIKADYTYDKESGTVRPTANAGG